MEEKEQKRGVEELRDCWKRWMGRNRRRTREERNIPDFSKKRKEDESKEEMKKIYTHGNIP